MPTTLLSVPKHLLPLVATQDPTLYTAIDHASWRFILRISRKFFAKHAHQKYLDGLEETGINLERIPLISEMDAKLSQFGWHAVPVVGFIPPNAFLEFLSLGILPIACDMRRLEHLAYTPAPDIVHEAAGHAPIVADPAYARYLRDYGELARKVIFSDKDIEVYEAIRNLSDTKEDPTSTKSQIEKAQKKLDQAIASVDSISEATLLSRMGWWTFEYGLVGDLSNPKIYGAGLLSSVGESYQCLTRAVKKIPMSIDCIKYSYDITKPQPQLFVTPDFPSLSVILREFESRMAFRRGGVEGLDKALRARTVTTSILDSGVQISGKLVEILTDRNGRPAYLRFEGPTQLAFDDKEISDQGAQYHAAGFSSPIGTVGGQSLTDFSDAEISSLGSEFSFDSGIVLSGSLTKKFRHQGKLLTLSYENCCIRQADRILFQPEWGTFDLVCGRSVVSVFGGAADRAKYLQDTGGFKQTPARQKTNLTKENTGLNALYAEVRRIRECGKADAPELIRIQKELDKKHPQDWLLRLELLELNSTFKLGSPWESAVRSRLTTIAKSSRDKQEMILRGLELVDGA